MRKPVQENSVFSNRTLLALLFLFYVFIPGSSRAQHEQMSFRRLSIHDGLSQNSVTCILKDRKGFLWFGTMDGLNRYDGYKFTVYRRVPGDSTSLQSNGVNAMLEDRQGNLWIGTNGGGLSRYNREKDSFEHFVESTDRHSISNDGITSLTEDINGNLWIGTFWGMNFLDLKTMEFRRFYYSETDPNCITHNTISSVMAAKDGYVFVSSREAGMNRFDIQTFYSKKFQYDPRAGDGIASNRITCMLTDNRNRLWIGFIDGGLDCFTGDKFIHYNDVLTKVTGQKHNSVFAITEIGNHELAIGVENQGLFILNTNNSKIVQYKNDVDREFTISNNTILSIYKDKTNILWLGTNTGGVNYFDPNEAAFSHFETPGKLLNAFCEDTSGKIWMGMDGGGVHILDPQKLTIQPLPLQGRLNSNVIVAMMRDKAGGMWLGTYGGGVNFVNAGTGTVEFFTEGNSDSDLSNGNVYALFEAADGRIWIGTLGGGLNILDRKTRKIKKLKHDESNPVSLGNNYISSIVSDSKGRIWIGTFGSGLSQYNESENNFKVFNTQNSKLSMDVVSTVFFDSNDDLWVGTMGGGLNHYDAQRDIFIAYTQANGLGNDFINGIEEDGHSNLWISTNTGVSKMNLKTRVINSYDGFQTSEFRRGASLKSSSGKLLFGGMEGFTFFHPDSVKSNPHVPPVILTGFQIFNKTVVPGPESPLERTIQETSEIILSHKQSMFTFEFAALNYTSPGKNNYAYKLEGFDKEWNLIGNMRRATYTNLDAGEYVFKVIASNNDGLWNENGSSIRVIITPPFWETWWFKSILLLSLIAAIYALVKIKIANIRRQKEVLERQVKVRTAEVMSQKEILELQSKDLQAMNEEQQALNEELQAVNEELQAQTNFLTTLNEELELQKEETNLKRIEAEAARAEAERANQAKSIFLATMSHEIRTPMNGVLGMAALLSETTLTDEQREFTDTILSSGETLLTVINDILDFSKIESGKMELDHQPFDLRQTVEEVMDLFANAASGKSIDLVYEIDYQIPAQIVGDHHRLRQILGNLMSNAMKFTQRGEIFIRVDLVKIDNSIIELAFHVRDSGIGIPKDKLTRLFKPFSQVDSSTTRKYGGTGLGLVISQRLAELMGGTISVESEEGLGTTFSFTIQSELYHEAIRQYVYTNAGAYEGRRVLVVDDNRTNLNILRNLLAHWKLAIIEASSGAEALALSESGYDLVITDLQMPGMDGVELAQKIRKSTPSVPIILLSSIGDESRKKHDDLFTVIINKPVKPQLLWKEIQNAFRAGNVVPSLTESKPRTILSREFADKYPLRILIAEDNVVNQKLTVRALTKLGYQDVHVTEDGGEAVKKFEERFFDVILMDVQMPGMDGLEATKLIRAKEGQQPVIISMTANAMQEDREVCLAAGMDDYIPKPIKLDDLVAALEKAAMHVKGFNYNGAKS
jgi:signal transduction histidine kinase/CheY-like chemotaxis protein/ligand-binding sensor domain-containing protein